MNMYRLNSENANIHGKNSFARISHLFRLSTSIEEAVDASMSFKIAAQAKAKRRNEIPLRNDKLNRRWEPKPKPFIRPNTGARGAYGEQERNGKEQ